MKCLASTKQFSNPEVFMSKKAMLDAIAAKKAADVTNPPKPVLKHSTVPGMRGPKNGKPKGIGKPAGSFTPKKLNHKQRKNAKKPWLDKDVPLGRYPDHTTCAIAYANKVWSGTITIPNPLGGSALQFTRSHTKVQRLLHDFWRRDYVPWCQANNYTAPQVPPESVKPEEVKQS